MNRVYAYIDGFNLYHSIVELKTPNKNRLKWLDIRALCSLFAKGDLREVYYFSAKFKIALLAPPQRWERANELRQNADWKYEIKPSRLQRSLFPNKIIRADGSAIIMPTEYEEGGADALANRDKNR